MLIASYIVLAVLVIGLSMRLSSYVDMLDKQTNLSGAFLGGVMLAAVTSLPELFTSISGVVFLNEPELVVGNILGSNLFNVAALSLVSLFGIKVIQRAAVSSSQGKTVLFSLAIYALLAVVAGDFFHIYFAGINIASFVIILLYIWGIKSLSLDDSSTEEAELAGDLSARAILLRFALLSVGKRIPNLCDGFVKPKIQPGGFLCRSGVFGRGNLSAGAGIYNSVGAVGQL